VQALRLTLLLGVAACKSRGTITLDFDLAGTTCTDFGSAASFVLYAEPGTGCSACACGACAGAGSNVVIGCPTASDGSCTRDDLADRGLDLSPGVWSVVLEAYDVTSTLIASQCLDITVDADGTRSESETQTNCTACH
jgi:hypothetical protein